MQEQEKKLYRELEVSAATGGVFGDQDAIVKKINELSAMRMTMFQELESMYASMQGRVAQSRIDLVDQMTVTGVMEQELNNAGLPFLPTEIWFLIYKHEHKTNLKLVHQNLMEYHFEKQIKKSPVFYPQDINEIEYYLEMNGFVVYN